jgi:hypothetical protein
VAVLNATMCDRLTVPAGDVPAAAVTVLNEPPA